VALLGATGMKITGNLITGNVPSADTEFSAGILVASGPGNPATAPADNRIHGNRILRNDPDLFWDQTGSGQHLRGDVCPASTPAGLCHHAGPISQLFGVPGALGRVCEVQADGTVGNALGVKQARAAPLSARASAVSRSIRWLPRSG